MLKPINDRLSSSARLVFAGLLMLGMQLCSLVTADKPDQNPETVLDVVELKKTDITESSGLAVSNVQAGHWWTHNDSGDKARIYAVNAKGKLTGRSKLKGVKADDWEDMAAFVHDGKPRLIVADCGDNLGKRDFITLHIFDEPDPTEKTEVKKIQTLQVAFPDRAHDCEAVAVDAKREKIVLVTKSKLPFALVYEVDLPNSAKKQDGAPVYCVARKITSVLLPLVSAMDIDAQNGDVWIANYFQAFHYPRTGVDQTLTDQLAKLPRAYPLPRWKQVEAIAVDNEHQVWITSEGKSPPLGRLNLAAPNR